METLCHRCGSSVNESITYCPNCGSPQLRLEANDEMQGLAGTSESAGDPSDRKGTSWKHAIRSAAMLGLPMGLLCSSALHLEVGSFLWIVGGAMGAVALYQRRSRHALVNLRTGLRIGILAGAIAAAFATACNAALLLFQRYALHMSKTIDDAMDSNMRTIVEQMSGRVSQSTPEAQAYLRAYFHFLLSPDGKAFFSLTNSAMTAMGMVLFAALGGALGARIFAAKSRPLSNS